MGMLLVQLDGTVFQANRFALEALGYPEDELKGMHVARLMPPSQRSNLKSLFSSLRESSGTTGKAEERPMLCRNGHEIWTNFHIVLQRSASGEPVYFIIQITDITENAPQPRAGRADGVLRHAHGSRESPALLAPTRASDQPCGALRNVRRAAVSGRRPVQTGERYARARGGRRDAARGRAAD